MTGRPKTFNSTVPKTITTHSEYKEVWEWTKQMSKQEGISVSLFIEHCLLDVMKIKKAGNPQVQLLHLTNERQNLSQTIQAKFVMDELNRSLEKLEYQKNAKHKDVNIWNFHINLIRKNLSQATSLSNSVFPEKFMKIFERVNKILEE